MAAHPPDAALWFSNEDVAKRYGVPLSTVRKWRHEGTGPMGVKFGRHVRYSAAELERWELEQIRKSTPRHGRGRTGQP